MRFAAACALAEARDSAALPELLAALRDDHRRQEALSALMAVGDPAAVPELEKLLEEESVGDFDRDARCRCAGPLRRCARGPRT